MLETISLEIITAIAKKAGDAILEIYAQPFDKTIEKKADNSPLTIADKASNEVIISGLSKHYPDIPYISEEAKQTDYATRKEWDYCWMIDPLDGTKEFIKKNGEFTVNIALLHNNESILGVVYVPVSDTMYYAKKGEGSYKKVGAAPAERINTANINTAEEVIIFASRSHRNQDTNDFIAAQEKKYGKVRVESAGSSLKFCLIAEGKVHIYPRFAPTMEWDTAAAHIVTTEAGGTISQPDGSAIVYNKENLLNPYFLVTA